MSAARPIEAIVRERVRAFMREHYVRGCGERVELLRLYGEASDEQLAIELAKEQQVSHHTIDRAELAFCRELERLVFECLGRSGVRVQLQEK